jgi:predicted double-glycine peptidase
MIWLSIQLLGSALMTSAGALAVRRSLRLGTALVGGMLVLILVKAGVSHFPAGEPRLFPWDWYPFVESWWHLFPAMFIFGAGMVIVRRSVWKRDGLLVGAGYLLLHCGVVAVLIGRPHEMLNGVVNAEGVCHQTSGYSCGPASAAMLLHRHGVDATEREMADLCVTRSGGTKMSGTSDSGLMRGLRLKLKDWATPVISAPPYEQIPVPALVAIQLSPSLCHCILVSAVEPDQVRVLDPLYGRGTIPRAQFERAWCRSAIHVEPLLTASR